MVGDPPSWPASWLVPDWPVPAQVRAVFTTREGGASQPPFDGFNLGDHVGDTPQAVAGNRATLARALGTQPLFMQQVHGLAVAELGPDPQPATVVADACLTSLPGRACTVMVADCLPVLLCDSQGRWVAAAHAGWRGLAGAGPQGPLAAPGIGVLESLWAALQRRVLGDGADPQAVRWLAWLGPCIGPVAFEVGAEVRSAFVVHDPGAEAHFEHLQAGKYRADLAGLARRRLHALGVDSVSGNDGSAAWCTVGQPSRFFSHRRDALRLGSTGRMAACIWLD